MYLFVKWLHIVFATIAIGVNVSYNLWFGLAKEEPSQYGFALKGIKKLDDYVANPCYLGLGISGPLMVYLGNWPWTTTWVWCSLALYAILSVLGVAVYSPLLKRQIAVLAERGHEDAEFQALNRKGGILGPGLGVIVLIVIYLMVVKPG